MNLQKDHCRDTAAVVAFATANLVTRRALPGGVQTISTVVGVERQLVILLSSRNAGGFLGYGFLGYN